MMPNLLWRRGHIAARRLVRLYAGASVLPGMLCPVVLGAQSATPVVSSAVAPTASSVAATAPVPSTDSSTPYQRYVTPGQCKQAAERLFKRYWRDKRRDTVVYRPATDSVPASVRRSILACASRFTPTSVADREVFDLVQLYQWTGQTDLWQAALTRLLGHERTLPIEHRAWVLSLLVDGALGAYPTQPAAAISYLAQLDSMGAPMGMYRMLGHLSLSQYWETVNDTSAAEAEARGALAASSAMPLGDRQDWAFTLIDVYSALVRPVSVGHPPAAALAIWDTALADLTPLRPPGSGDLAMLQGQIMGARAPYTLLGTEGVPVHGDHWYGTPDDSTPPPRRGQVTLLIFGGHLCGGECYPLYAVLRRLHDRYGPDVRLVLMTSTAGSYRNRVEPDPAAEADSARHYFLDFLRLPITLAVDETPFSRKADGRRVDGQLLNQTHYARGVDAILVGRDGVVLMACDLTPRTEPMLTAMIATALRPAIGTSATRSGSAP